jgi:hypothetical protein
MSFTYDEFLDSAVRPWRDAAEVVRNLDLDRLDLLKDDNLERLLALCQTCLEGAVLLPHLVINIIRDLEAGSVRDGGVLLDVRQRLRLFQGLAGELFPECMTAGMLAGPLFGKLGRKIRSLFPQPEDATVN